MFDSYTIVLIELFYFFKEKLSTFIFIIISRWSQRGRRCTDYFSSLSYIQAIYSSYSAHSVELHMREFVYSGYFIFVCYHRARQLEKQQKETVGSNEIRTRDLHRGKRWAISPLLHHRVPTPTWLGFMLAGIFITIINHRESPILGIFRANLTRFGPKSDIPDWWDNSFSSLVCEIRGEKCDRQGVPKKKKKFDVL